jgi:hypothetical protein
MAAANVSSNNRMQRSGSDKVLGRGRVSAVPEQVTSARVLNGLRAVADADRSATQTRRAKSDTSLGPSRVARGYARS